jgi:inosose dehydratase
MTPLGCQEWPWVCFWRGQGKRLGPELERSMAWSREAGFAQWEGSLPAGEAEAQALRAALRGSGSGLRSLYANARLHEGDPAAHARSLAARCAAVKDLGLEVLVLNPEPIEWGQALEKSDAELTRQGEALGALRVALDAEGIALAYHIHDSEMRSQARELWVTLRSLPALRLCLECEWQARGGWDAAAIQGFVQAQAGRMAAAHLRQIKQGKPQLALGFGEIDYPPIARLLLDAGYQGPWVFEGYQESPVDETTMRSALKASAAFIQTELLGAPKSK